MIKLDLHDPQIVKDYAARILKSVSQKQKYKEGWSFIVEFEDFAREIYQYTPEDLRNLEALEQKFNDKMIKITSTYGILQEDIIDLFFDYKGTSTQIVDNITNAHWLVQKKNIRVCPYCNHSYVFTRDQEMGKGRPHLDHYHPQSKYPFLALSFYNLIPVCPQCNNLKGDQELDFYPYLASDNDTFQFRLVDKGRDDQILLEGILSLDCIDIQLTTSETTNFIKPLHLDSLYKQHQVLAQDLINKSLAYNQGYYDSIIESFADLGLGYGDVYRLVFGTAYSESEMQNIPLSKFTKDILEQLGIRY